MKRYFALVALLLCVLALAACGDATATSGSGSTTSTAGTGTTSTAGAATTARTGTTVASTTSAAGTTSATGAATTSAANTTAAAGTTSATGANTTSAAGTTSATGAVTTSATGATTTLAAGAATTAPGAGANNTAATLGLPIYTGLKPLSLGTVFEQTIAQSLLGQAGTSSKYGIFSTSDSTDKVISFYDSAMQQAGFTKAAAQNIPNTGSTSGINLGGQVVAYSKGTGNTANGAAVTILGPLDVTAIALFSSQSPSAASQLKPGDFMVFVFNNVNTANMNMGAMGNMTMTTGTGMSITPTVKP